MPQYGPWLTPPLQHGSRDWSDNATVKLNAQVDGDTSTGGINDFALLCEGANVWGEPGDGRASWTLDSPLGEYHIGQLRVAVPMEVAMPTTDYSPPTWPSGAVDIDYDPTDTDHRAWLRGSPSLTGYMNVNPSAATGYELHAATVQVRAHVAGDLSSAVTGFPDQLRDFDPGTYLGGRPLLGTVTAPATVSTIAVTWTVDPADIAVAGTAGLGNAWALFVLHYTAQVSHTAPGAPVVGILSGNYIAWIVSGGPLWHSEFDYQPRRYRFVYATLPPLRQYPRDDFLAGAPRQGHVNQPKSIQASSRQGWAGAYR